MKVRARATPLLVMLSALGVASVVALVALGVAAVGLLRSSSGATEGAVVSAGAAHWGPLAVVRPFDSGAEALRVGTLRITRTCTYLEQPSRHVLVVWPSDRTTWDDRGHVIVFRNSDGTELRLGDGMRVELGGGGSAVEEGGPPGDAWIQQVLWVNAPQASCPLDDRWIVGDHVSVG